MAQWRSPFPRRARGQMPAHTMNKTEAAYAEHLERRKQAGHVLWWAFEPFKFRLAKNTWYTPDFGVMLSSWAIECHEVKGFWRDDARVKIKVAAETVPFKFVAVKKTKTGWDCEEF